MERTITINPVTRIEGHAHITLHLNEQGKVHDAQFHLTQFRGFEKFCEGRPFPEMPALTARTCGICPVSHLVASSKACDRLLSVTIPPAAAKLRRVMNLAQLAQSHALSYFHLSAPRSAAGLGCRSLPTQYLRRDEYNTRSWHGWHYACARLVRPLSRSSEARRFIQAGWSPAVSVNRSPKKNVRPSKRCCPKGYKSPCVSYEHFKKGLVQFKDDSDHFGNFETLFLSLVTPQGGLEHYDGVIRIKDAAGNIIEDMSNRTTTSA